MSCHVDSGALAGSPRRTAHIVPIGWVFVSPCGVRATFAELIDAKAVSYRCSMECIRNRSGKRCNENAGNRHIDRLVW
jgi:hypothetical protein